MLDYIQAVNNRDCKRAWDLLSVDTRHGVDVLRVPYQQQTPVKSEEYYCNTLAFEDCKWQRMELISEQGDAATISMQCGHTKDSFLPGWPSPFLRYEPRETTLVREDGAWHVEDSFVLAAAGAREAQERMRDAVMREHERVRQR